MQVLKIPFVFSIAVLVIAQVQQPLLSHQAHRLLDPHDPWIVKTEQFSPNKFQVAPYVANGYFGQSLPAEGVGHHVYRNTKLDTTEPNGMLPVSLNMKKLLINRTLVWPLAEPRQTFGTVSGFWDLQDNIAWSPGLPESMRSGGNSVISGIPNWTGLFITTEDGQTYAPGIEQKHLVRYERSWSLRDGLVRTNVTWSPPPKSHMIAARNIQLNYAVIAHRAQIHLGLVELILVSTSSQPNSLLLTDYTDGHGGVRAEPSSNGRDVDEKILCTSVQPYNISSNMAHICSITYIDGRFEIPEPSESLRSTQSQMSRSRSWNITLLPGIPVTVRKYVGISHGDQPSESKTSLALAKRTALNATRQRWSSLLDKHSDAWKQLWKSIDISIPSDQTLEQAARMSLFHLLTNTSPGESISNSISVSGLGSDAYGGMIFWDAETWMYPALLAFNPEAARTVLDYRLGMFEQAQKNAQRFGMPGVLYPWTSARWGNCTSTGFCAGYQYHINFDIALAFWQYFLVTGDKVWLREKGWQVIREVARMFASLVRWDNDTGKYVIDFVSDPDEYANGVNNSAYTNAGVKMLLGQWAPKAALILNVSIPANWTEIAENIEITMQRESYIVLEYTGMKGNTMVKQASVALLNHPLDFRFSNQQALNDVDYYSPLTSPNGPAMSYPIFAITSANLAPSGCAAYTYLLRSVLPYLRKPFYQFSEMINDDWRSNGALAPAFPFLTAHGAYLQILTHGFLGMKWTLDDNGEGELFLNPVMVPQLSEGLGMKGLKWRGITFDVWIGLVNTTITYAQDSVNGLETVEKTFRFTIRGLQHSLSRGESVIIPTRRPDLQSPTIEGNLAQCRHVESSSPHVQGQFPVSIVDGSNATVWQPATTTPSSVAIDLGSELWVKKVILIWGARPPSRFTLHGGTSEDESTRLWQHDGVLISAPYQADDFKEVKLRQGNETMITFPKPVYVRWLKLTIAGSHDLVSRVGATVAEVVVL